MFRKWILVLLVVFLGGCGLLSRERLEFEDVEQNEDFAVLEIGGVEVVAEVNKAGERKNRGGATYVYPPGADGVLYDFEDEAITAFNALLLDKGADFVWIGRDIGKDGWVVVGINKNVRPGRDEDTGVERAYGIDRPASYMLEVRNGWVWDNRIRIADPVEFVRLPEASASAEVERLGEEDGERYTGEDEGK